jgi:hypothetical protein
MTSRLNELAKKLIGKTKDAPQLLVRRTRQERKMKFALIAVAAAAIATPALAEAVFKGPGYCAWHCANANYQTCGPTDPVIDRFYREAWLDSPYNVFMDLRSHQCRPMQRR